MLRWLDNKCPSLSQRNSRSDGQSVARKSALVPGVLTEEAESSPSVSTSLLKRVMELCSRATSIFCPALTSEIRHATDSQKTRHFTTLLNSEDPATPLPGTGHASVKSVHAL